MASNYEAICEENRLRYGTVGAQKSGGLAAGLYDNRTHFIFELLQNAEDALGRRGDWKGSRKVTFALTPKQLTLSHFGKPFDEADVRSVCDIAESTKNESSIGRFGLGFKSVYTVTDLPEIHSGDEDFAIEGYVFPKQSSRTSRLPEETQITLSLRTGDRTAKQDITTGLRNLGPRSLLFLRNIEEINWSVEGGASGFYMRTQPEVLGPNVQRVTVIGHQTGQDEVDQNWLVFHRDVFTAEGKKVGRVEIAFSQTESKEDSGRWSVQPLPTSPLVVFFPTVVETHLGFLVQGPYRTTPSRENTTPGDPWNQHLVQETSRLLVEAMRWMRDKGMLDISVLRCLPIDRKKFPQGSQFAPLFEAVRQAFQEESLLPTFDGKYVAAPLAKLARTHGLRELFSPKQVSALFGVQVSAWLSGEITEDKEREIRQYLIDELKIAEIRPERLLPSLSKPFLETQSDEWILRLYEFLSGQGKIVRPHLDTAPIIRLENGKHVVAREGQKVNAFLPSAITTSFPTMRRAVCSTPEVRLFLSSLGITEPDPVDDVIWNLLPKYQQKEVAVDDETYAADIDRIRAAFNSDSNTQKEKLRSALRTTHFVMVVDTGDGTAYVAKPGEVYIATDRLQQLFAGVPGILIVDNEYDCLRGEEIRDLLVSCGASRYLVPQAAASGLDYSKKMQLRKEAGLERATWESPLEDFTLRGLAELLDYLPTLDSEAAAARSKVLWEALTDLEARGTAIFLSSYRWGYSHITKEVKFDASFIRALNQEAWLPSPDGGLVQPTFVMFDTLGWKASPFLQAKIRFKPPIIDQLAKEAGIPPEVLDLLQRDPALVAELLSRKSIGDQPPKEESLPDEDPSSAGPSDGDVYDDAQDLYGNDMPDISPGTPDPDAGDDFGKGSAYGGRGRPSNAPSHDGFQGPGRDHGGNGARGASGNNRSSNASTQGNRAPGKTGSRPFISYLGTHPDDDGPDPDGLDQTARMQLEGRAIDLIISLEPALLRTPNGNPGFDLYEVDTTGKQSRWVEVKSMTGSLEDRPVGLSHTQFDFARAKSDAYWLYVVEYADDRTKARILKIQNPVAHAKTFTFDHGWKSIAQVSAPSQAPKR